MESAIPPVPQNAGKKKMGCLKMLFIAFLSVIGLFIVMAICIPTPKSAKKEEEVKIAEIEARKSAALLEKFKSEAEIKAVQDFVKKIDEIKGELGRVKAERDKLAERLKETEEKLAAMGEEKKKLKADSNGVEYNMTEAKEKQAQVAKNEAAQKEAEETLLKELSPREKAFYFFKKKFLVNKTGSYRFPTMEYLIKTNSNDPDSFEHIELRCKFEPGKKKRGLGNIVLQEKFRGKNAFGAKIINYAVVVYDFDKEDIIQERNNVGDTSLEGMTLVADVRTDQLKETKELSVDDGSEAKGKVSREKMAEVSPETKMNEITVSDPVFRKVESTYDITTYSWKASVKNTYDQEKKVMITFKLLDKDGFAIETAHKMVTVPAGKSVSVSEKGMVDDAVYKQAKSCEASPSGAF